MTAVKAAPAPLAYRSGFCSSGFHPRCRGEYGNVICDCPCHAEPETVTVRCFFGCPHVVVESTPDAAHDGMEAHYFETHRDDIARAVGWPTATT